MTTPSTAKPTNITALEAKLNNAQKRLDALHGDTPRLTAMRDEALEKMPELRSQARAGKITLEDLTKAESDASTRTSLLNHHALEIESVQGEVETTTADLEQANDDHRYQELESAFNGNVEKRLKLEQNFISTVRKGLTKLLENAQDLIEEATEMKSIRQKKHPNAKPTYDEVENMAYEHYADMAVSRRFSHPSSTFTTASEGFRAFLRDGGPGRLLSELQQERGQESS